MDAQRLVCSFVPPNTQGKKLYFVIPAVVFSLTAPVQAQQPSGDRLTQQAAPRAVGGPLKVIYRVSGVRDNGGVVNTGIATTFHCTNYTGVTQEVRIRIFDFDASSVADVTAVIGTRRTRTSSTHATVAFSEDASLSAGTVIEQGSAVIWATTRKVICTAMIVDAASDSPVGIPLHMVRFNAVKGSTE